MLRSRDLYSEIEISREKLAEIEKTKSRLRTFHVSHHSRTYLLHHFTVAHITDTSWVAFGFIACLRSFFLTNCCDSWPLRARRRKCRVGAVQASDSYVSRLVTGCPSCVTLLLSDICVFVRFGEIWTSSWGLGRLDRRVHEPNQCIYKCMAAHRDWSIDFCWGMRDARLGQHCNALTARKKDGLTSHPHASHAQDHTPDNTNA